MTARTRIPITSRVWFFPTLILLMPLVSRACMNLGKPQRQRDHFAVDLREKACMEEYQECILECPGDPYDDVVTDAEQECLDNCYLDYEQCLEGPEDSGPTCDAQTGYCGYDTYDYGEPEYDDSASDWSCDSGDDYDSYDSSDSTSDWSCSSSDDTYDESEDYSDDGGWDCSSDNYDEGDSGDGDDWGEDWGERSPGGGDGIESPLDLGT